MGANQSHQSEVKNIQKQFEIEPPGPNPFTDAECKQIVEDCQFYIEKPFNVDEDVSIRDSCNIKALQYCGGLKKLDLRRPFIGTANMTTEEMTYALANNPTMDREEIKRNFYRIRQCRKYDEQMDNGNIHELVYDLNCSHVPRVYWSSDIY